MAMGNKGIGKREEKLFIFLYITALLWDNQE